MRLAGGQGDVVQHRQVGKELVALKDHAHLLAQGGEIPALPGNGSPLQSDSAALDGLKGVDAAQKGAFAAAAGTHDDHHLALAHGEVQAVEHGVLAVALYEALYSEERFCHGLTSTALPGAGPAD